MAGSSPCACAKCGSRSGFSVRRGVLWLAQPTPRSLLIGGAIAVAGELLRIWAAGHLEKGREVTRSGPYRLTRHPLYLGLRHHRRLALPLRLRG